MTGAQCIGFRFLANARAFVRLQSPGHFPYNNFMDDVHPSEMPQERLGGVTIAGPGVGLYLPLAGERAEGRKGKPLWPEILSPVLK